MSNMRSTNIRVLLAIGLAVSCSSVQAAFHFMQIEQLIGGVQGDTTAQAIQLRMRIAGQAVVSGSRLVAHDAAGLNPVELINIGSNVTNSALGSRVLLTSAQFQNTQMQPAIASDFTTINLIPASYLAAGRLTYENSAGTTIYWSVCWGGAAYTGSTTGSTTNDADGNFGPCFGAALPSSSDQTLQFTGAAAALSTNNAADYMTTAGQAVFTNNAGAFQTVPVELQHFSVD